MKERKVIVTCIHGRTANTRESVECIDCEELAALRELEDWLRYSKAPARRATEIVQWLDAVRLRKGIGTIGNPETR